jgi:CubicO group peptidase (beta-lactamase class C family)
MKRFIILLTFLISITVFGQQSQDSLIFKLDQYFMALTGLKHFNGNVAIAKENKILLNKTYNIESESDSLRVSKTSKFIIASVSKVFINFSILKLVEQNRLNLDDTLSKFISDFPNGDKITVDQLMYHKAGLPRELTDYDKHDNLTLGKVVELAKKEKLQFEPNTNTLYSNVGYFLLHYIIDKASQEGYPLFTQNILKKMKLNNTGEYNTKNIIKNFEWGFDDEQGKIIPTSEKSIDRFETGNYYSTITDMYSFSEQMLSGKVLKTSLALKMFGQDSILMQAGGRPGYRAYFYKNLKTNVTFIFLSNFTDIPIQEVTADVVNIIANKPYEIPQKINRVKINLTEDILKRYIGKYSLEAGATQIFIIRLENGKLFISDKEGEKSEMNADTETTFFDDPHSKDGYVFSFNQQEGKYGLTIISTGIRLKMKRLE